MSNRSLLHTTLDTSLRAKLDALLYDKAEGCVPKGAISSWIEDRIREYVAQQEGYKAQAEVMRGQ
jgi:hypothetical protein